MTVEANKATIAQYLKSPCLVDFYTTGCPSCEKIAPVFEEVSQHYSHVSFLKVNLDEDTVLAQRYGVSIVPTLILFQEGEPVHVLEGYQDKDALDTLMELEKEAGA